MSYIINNDLQINYASRGHGEPLVMHHPNGHCIKDWSSLGYVHLLEKYFQLILIDSRGFGDSDKPHDAAHYDPKLIASDTIAVLDNLGISKAFCFGYSMGGRNALALMQYYPERFKSFVIGGAHPYPVNKLRDSYTKLLQQGLPKLVEVLEKNFGAFPAEVKHNFLQNDLTALITINSLPLTDYSAALENYNDDVSFIIGEKDPMLPYVRQAHESKSGSVIHVIPGKDHMQLFFSAELIVPLLLNTFIRNIE